MKPIFVFVLLLIALTTIVFVVDAAVVKRVQGSKAKVKALKKRYHDYDDRYYGHGWLRHPHIEDDSYRHDESLKYRDSDRYNHFSYDDY
ncbi:22661_t:CDS:2 [Cetraspora pellucida]|uniref:22661_t:CDS:1 n=1 Tax=Cetraspora pellucida TaxID=1433469 RepID=A0A9N9FEI9_9GLOM|nr:22661_t:CDS:2 [Cetraspora pellucida]